MHDAEASVHSHDAFRSPRSSREEDLASYAPCEMPQRHSRSDPLPSPAERGRAPAAPARCPSTPLESTWSSGEAATEAGLPSLGSTASRPVLTRLIVDPERLDKSIPVLVGTELSQGGKRLLCIHHVQSGGAQGSRIAALRLSALNVSRYWGCPKSQQRMLELTVPGREAQAGTLHLAIDDYDSLSRLAHMMGREHFD
jgi:hypothetical protein